MNDVGGLSVTGVNEMEEMEISLPVSLNKEIRNLTSVGMCSLWCLQTQQRSWTEEMLSTIKYKILQNTTTITTTATAFLSQSGDTAGSK